MIESLSEVDTSRAPDKPDLRPLPDEPPEDPTDHGWARGLRDWYWSEIRHELHVFTGGAASYTDRYYEMGYEVLEVLERRARDRALAFPSDEAREWFRAGLHAASFSIGEKDEILMQGPESLPDFFLEKALTFVVRRADRALDLYGEETDTVDRDLSAFDDDEAGGGEEADGGDPEPDTEPAEGEETGESAPQQTPDQGTLF